MACNDFIMRVYRHKYHPFTVLFGDLCTVRGLNAFVHDDENIMHPRNFRNATFHWDEEYNRPPELPKFDDIIAYVKWWSSLNRGIDPWIFKTEKIQNAVGILFEEMMLDCVVPESNWTDVTVRYANTVAGCMRVLYRVLMSAMDRVRANRLQMTPANIDNYIIMVDNDPDGEYSYAICGEDLALINPDGIAYDRPFEEAYHDGIFDNVHVAAAINARVNQDVPPVVPQPPCPIINIPLPQENVLRVEDVLIGGGVINNAPEAENNDVELPIEHVRNAILEAEDPIHLAPSLQGEDGSVANDNGVDEGIEEGECEESATDSSEMKSDEEKGACGGINLAYLDQGNPDTVIGKNLRNPFALDIRQRYLVENLDIGHSVRIGDHVYRLKSVPQVRALVPNEYKDITMMYYRHMLYERDDTVVDDIPNYRKFVTGDELEYMKTQHGLESDIAIAGYGIKRSPSVPNLRVTFPHREQYDESESDDTPSGSEIPISNLEPPSDGLKYVSYNMLPSSEEKESTEYSYSSNTTRRSYPNRNTAPFYSTRADTSWDRGSVTSVKSIPLNFADDTLDELE